MRNVGNVSKYVRFQILRAASMKMTTFWDVAPCSLVEQTDVPEASTASIIRVVNHPDDGGSTHL
jgi:hypothetical protein